MNEARKVWLKVDRNITTTAVFILLVLFFIVIGIKSLRNTTPNNKEISGISQKAKEIEKTQITEEKTPEKEIETQKVENKEQKEPEIKESNSQEEKTPRKKFYLRVKFKETKVDSKVRFEPLGIEPLYGFYDSFFEPFNERNPKDYVLETYNSQKELQARYSLSSSRYIFWDSIDGGGGIIESDSGTLSAIIPYNREEPTRFIRIASAENLEDKTRFFSIAVENVEKAFKEIESEEN